MKKVKIIAHRGGFLPEGPIPEVSDKYTIPENTLEAFERAFKNGWGLETDVREGENGNFVLIHDADSHRFVNYPQFRIPTLAELCQLAKRYANGQTPFIAFQVKRGSQLNSGVKVGSAVAQGIWQYGLENSILFDATFEEAQMLHREFPWLNLSVSVGEENYSPTIYTPDQALTSKFTSIYTSVWTDEWKISGSIYNEAMFKKFRAAYPGRIDVISPELHYNENHPLSKDLDKLKELWKNLISWDIPDGICTDYPAAVDSLI